MPALAELTWAVPGDLAATPEGSSEFSFVMNTIKNHPVNRAPGSAHIRAKHQIKDCCFSVAHTAVNQVDFGI